MLIIPMWLQAIFYSKTGPTKFYYRPRCRKWWRHSSGATYPEPFTGAKPRPETMENIIATLREIQRTYGESLHWSPYTTISSYCAVISPTQMRISIRDINYHGPDDPLPWNQPTETMKCIRINNSYRRGYSPYPADDMNPQPNCIYAQSVLPRSYEIEGIIRDRSRKLMWRRVAASPVTGSDEYFSFKITDWDICPINNDPIDPTPTVRTLSRVLYDDEIPPTKPSPEDRARIASRVFMNPLRGHSYYLG